MGRFTVDNGIVQAETFPMGIDYLQYAGASMNDVALVTPLRDGINHVAKEYIAARTGRTGFLILSEMAGAAQELGEAILINPNNISAEADALREAAAGDSDIHVLFLPPGADIEINALQRASAVVLQKSFKEGFGLTVAEALWKARPVIAGAVGGIPLQITHKYSGILTYSIEGTAFYLKQLLSTPDYAKKLGDNGREHIRNNFLITRHIRDYLLLFLSLYHPGDTVRLTAR